MPDAGTDHYPVQPGAENRQTCLAWATAAGPVTVRVEFRYAFDATVHAPPREYTVPAGATSFTLPASEFGPLPGPDQLCTDRLPYLIELTAGGERLGGVVSRSGCRALPVTAEGCIGPGPAGIALSLELHAIVPGSSVFLGPIPDGQGRFPACVAWADQESAETAFRIELTYFGSGERFVYRLPPNSVAFVIPEADSTLGEPGSPEWGGRKDFGIQVIAETPGGDEPAGATAVQVM